MSLRWTTIWLNSVLGLVGAIVGLYFWLNAEFSDVVGWWGLFPSESGWLCVCLAVLMFGGLFYTRQRVYAWYAVTLLLCLAVVNGSSATYASNLWLTDFFIWDVSTSAIKFIVSVILALGFCVLLGANIRAVPELIFILTSLVWACLVMIHVNDLFVLYLFFEILSFLVCLLFILVTVEYVGFEAGIKYFIFNGLASLFFGLALVGIFLSFGTLNYTGLIANSEQTVSFMLLGVVSFVALAAMFGKLGTLPFSPWVVDVYSSAPLQVLFFILVPIKLVLFVWLFKLYLLFSIQAWGISQVFLLVVGLSSLVWGCFGAFNQVRIKRFLGYTSINQTGYLLLCLLGGSFNSWLVFWLYLIFYCITTMGVLVVLLLLQKLCVECTYFTDVGLVSRQVKMAPLVIFSSFFSFAGIPPFVGFYTKFLLIEDLFLNRFYAVVGVILLTSLVSVFYYIRITKLLTLQSSYIVGQITTNAMQWWCSALLFCILLMLVSFLVGGDFIISAISDLVAFITQTGFLYLYLV